MSEQGVIDRVLELLEEHTGLGVQWIATQDNSGTEGRLELSENNTRHTFFVEFKREVKPLHLMKFKELQQQFGDLIILGQTIYPAIREQLRKLQINYADAAGNCFIKKSTWTFYLDGFKNEVIASPRKHAGFSKKTLPLIFHFLNDENYLNVTYRQMVEDYGISLGQVSQTISALQDQQYIIHTEKKKFKIFKRKEMLDAWIEAYGTKLKPHLKLGSFRFMNRSEKDWQSIELAANENQWGGEPAAALLTNYLKPGKLTLYTTQRKVDLVKNFPLVPQEDGVLEIYQRFWKFTDCVTDTVSPILVYADLVNTGDSRNLETANRLYDEKLRGKFLGACAMVR